MTENHHTALHLSPPGEGAPGGLRQLVLSPWRRFLALLMTLLLMIPSPSVMAITMGQIKAGIAGGGAGGRGGAANLQSAGAASADLTASLARNTLLRSNELLKAVQTAQEAARGVAKVAASGAVPAGAPNGLKNGWLEPHVVGGGQGIAADGTANTASWSGASMTTKAGNPRVEITQTTQNAYLYWNHFNVGPQTTINFDQSGGGENAGGWIAYNKVMSATDPSHIFGKIEAQGQVYIQNQNGILFHNGSTVNVRALVASTLPVNANLAGDTLKGLSSKGAFNTVDFSRWGKLNNPSRENLFTLGERTAAQTGDVVVEKGAVITAGTTAQSGMAAFVAPNVRNDASATISADKTYALAGERVLPTAADNGLPEVKDPGRVVIGEGKLYANKKIGDDASAGSPLDSMTPSGNLVLKLDDAGNVTFRPDSWSGAFISSPLFSKSMEITQTSQSAYLGWNKFSPLDGMTVNFNQAAGGSDVGKWTAFNTVTGKDGTTVGGDLAAKGQIYLLDQNGITFGDSASVNVHSLLASTLPINENLIGNASKSGRGVANNPDYQYLFTALHVDGDAKLNTASFDPVITAADGKLGDVVVSPGASILSPSDANHTGGLVALIGPNVINRGMISTPNGQTVLGAGLQVGLTPHGEPSLRGMKTYVGAIDDASGAVGSVSGDVGSTLNEGVIRANQGDITLAGATVNQNGVLEGSTAAGLNGRIDIAAIHDAVLNPKFTPDGLNGSLLLSSVAGRVTLGEKSVIRILPEWEDTSTKVIGSALALNSLVTVNGSDVSFGKDSILFAPGAVATQGATGLYGDNLYSGVVINAFGPFEAASPANPVKYSSGRIDVAEGAVIDVGGSTGIAADSSQYMLQLQLRGPELANSPLQRENKAIRGQTITVDSRITGTFDGRSWIGTPLGDASGYVGLVQRTVGQLTTAGGSISLMAGDGVSLANGSSVNVSGGWTRYSGGTFSTTKLLGADGRIYDISQATPDRIYTGILKDTPGNYEPSYLSGASGGALSIQAPSVTLDGDLHGTTVTGFRQLRNGDRPGTPPAPSSLAVSLQGQALFQGASVFASRYAPDVVLGSSRPSSGDRPAMLLDPGVLSAAGFGNLSIINPDGRITLEKESAFDAGLGGSVNLEGANLDLKGTLLAPGGKISLTADLIPLDLRQVAPIDPVKNDPQSFLGLYEIRETGERVYQFGEIKGGRITVLHSDMTGKNYGVIETLDLASVRPASTGSIALYGSTLLSSAGMVTSDAFASSSKIEANAAVLDGGTISLSGYNVSLGGAILDVSGGAHQSAKGAVTYGNGGKITLSGGVNGTMTSGSLDLSSTLLGFGGVGKRGGSLDLSSKAFAIGTLPRGEGINLLDPGFFNQGGFESFSLTGSGLKKSPGQYVPGIELLPGVVLNPQVASTVLGFQSGQAVLTPGLLPAAYRPVPSIGLHATGVVDLGLPPAEQLLVRGDVVLGPGSSITLNPGLLVNNGQPSARTGSLSISGQSVTVAGSVLSVPGGSLSVNADHLPENVDEPDSAKVSVDIRPGSVLSTAGTVLYGADPRGIKTHFGTVLAGGNISLTGNLLLQAGSKIDVSGTAGGLDLYPFESGKVGGALAPVTVDSSAGSISLKGSEALRSDATMLARAGGSSSEGGSLIVSSGRFYGLTDAKSPTDFTLSVVSGGHPAEGLDGIGQSISKAPGIAKGGGLFSASSLAGAGFDNLTLAGNVFFSGESGGVEINLPGEVRVATKGLLAADTSVTLEASHATLGTPFIAPLGPLDTRRLSVLDPDNQQVFAPPTWGEKGSLTVKADLIDIGNLSLSGIGSAKLQAGRGDKNNGTIRGNGNFVMSGDLTMAAGMIYPSSGTKFKIVSFNRDAKGAALSSGGTPGTIVIEEGMRLPAPLSAGGTLEIYADSISQSGNLYAPFGKIMLGASGTTKDPMSGLAAPSSTGIFVTGGVVSVSGLDPLSGKKLTVPYGTSADGTTWIDPSGTDITAQGLSLSSVAITGSSLDLGKGSLIDLRGGGEVTANRWVSGLGGTIDYLSRADSYAIVPGYQSSFAPSGYGEGGVRVGSSVILPGTEGLPAGTYTLLPAGYATLPGAFLLTLSTASTAPGRQPDGSYLVAGRMVNVLNRTAQDSPLVRTFRLDPPKVLAAKAQYDVLKADSFFASLPSTTRTADSSPLRVQAGDALTFQGSVRGTPGSGGRGAMIDLSGALNFRIGKGDAAPGTVVIDPEVLNGLDAGSLLIGGFRDKTASGFSITSEATSVSVDSKVSLKGPELILSAAPKTHRAKAGESFDDVSGAYDGVDAADLAGSNPDAILSAGQTITLPKDKGDYTTGNGETLASIAAANGVKLSDLVSGNTGATVVAGTKLRVPGQTAALTLGSGASVTASGNASGDSYTVTGDGVLLLASASSGTSLSRASYLPNATSASGTSFASLRVLGSTFLRGGSVILDSSASGAVNQTATLEASAVAIRSGKLAVDGGSGNTSISGALTIKGALLQGISRAGSLELTSYSSLNLINGARLGSTDQGKPLVSSMTLRAGSITGDGSDAEVTSSSLLLDNAYSSAPSARKNLGGGLYLNADLLQGGSGNLMIRGFKDIYAAAASAFQGNGKGGIAADGNLTLWTPLVTTLGGSASSLSASGALKVLKYPGSSSAPVTGLGGRISFTGSSVQLGAPVVVKSGSVSAKALSGNLTLSSVIDVSGTVQAFVSEKRFTDAGSISLSADQGDITFTKASALDLSAQDGGGNAGALAISSPLGIMTAEGSINTSAKAGSGGSVSADLKSYGSGNIDPLLSFLAPFIGSQAYRFRSGDVSMTGAKTHEFRLSADQGSIVVNGTIDASGEHGGNVSLLAGKSLTLADSALLSVHGMGFDAAGKGGMINLEAGNSSAAVIASKAPSTSSGLFDHAVSVLDLGGATLDLGVDATPREGQSAGTLLLKAPQTADAKDLQINPLHAVINGFSAISAVGNNRIDAATVGAAAIDKLPVFGNLPVGLPYLPGQKVVSVSDGKVYQLTANSATYAKYVANEVAGGNSVDPSDSVSSGSTYWKPLFSGWDDSGATAYSRGTKVYNKADGLIYTASERIPPNQDTPEAPGASAIWTLAKDEGNYQAIALANASSFTGAVAAGGNRFAGSASYKDAVRLQPGEEIMNTKGSLVLNSDWDLSLARYGATASVLDSTGKKTGSSIGINPGLLTLRAAGDIVLRGAITDGFGNSSSSSAGLSPGLYKDPLLPLLDASGAVMAQRSWSYRITAGADFRSADSQSFLGGAVGSVSVGVPYRVPDGYSGGADATTLNALFGYYQPIRTGTGSIAISSSGDLQIWNDFSSIYTAGARVLDPTMGGRFDIPSPDLSYKNENLGYSASGYDVSFSHGGGNISISTGRDITRLALQLDSGTGGYLYDNSGKSSVVAASVTQMPSNWLLRRGAVDPATGLFLKMPGSDELASTSWWIDFSNFFQGVGALGGGNVTMTAAGNVANVDAVIPTSFRMSSRDASGNPIKPGSSQGVELGGGDLKVSAGNNIDAGVYYVEKGLGSLVAGGGIISNPTRDSGLPGGPNSTFAFNSGNGSSDPQAFLPTTLFQGKGADGAGVFTVRASGDILLGPVANAFLMPQSINNGVFYSTYFSTYDPGNRIAVSSLNGDVVLREGAANIISSGVVSPLLQIWMQQDAYASGSGNLAYYQPWTRSSELNMTIQTALFTIQPPTLDVTVPSGSITIQGNLNLSPAARGNLSLLASGRISGYAKSGSYNNIDVYGTSVINLSDADPAKVPGTTTPLARISSLPAENRSDAAANTDPASSGTVFYTDALGALFSETGSYAGTAAQIATKLALHDQNGQLHSGDATPLTLTAGGQISGLTLFSPKHAIITAGEDISDVGFYIQNVAASDISVVSAGRNITLYDPLSALRSYAALQIEPFSGFPSGDLQISGPGSLQLLAANSIDLGNQTGNPDDITTWNGITSVGNARNPGLPFQGADLVLGAGIAAPSGLGSGSALKLQAFADEILSGPSADAYLKELRENLSYSGLPADLNLTKQSLSAGSDLLTAEQKALLQTRLFYLVLRDTGRGFNDPKSPGYRSYAAGEKAIAKVFGSGESTGSITAWSRDIRTKNGGDISILAPGGGVKLASTQPPNLTTTPGIVTEHGGVINLFTKANVDLGIGRIFTLRGGDILIWSDKGNIAAGSSAKTVASAPPARVLFDPQSGDVITDLAGLSTGGGIGVLDTVAGIPPGNVDLLAPSGFIDAGDAGIRSSGNLNLAAQEIRNADNIMVGGISVGAPAPAAPAAAAPAAPPPAAAPPAASTAAAANNAAADSASKKSQNTAQADQTPSVFSIDILGYGGGDGEEEEKSKKAASLGAAGEQVSL
jgi:filamentous hemagglutinin